MISKQYMGNIETTPAFSCIASQLIIKLLAINQNLFIIIIIIINNSRSHTFHD